MKTIFYLRSGKRVPRKSVYKSRMAYVEGKRTGKFSNGLICSIQPTVADGIEKMRDEDFADWTGSYTWKRIY